MAWHILAALVGISVCIADARAEPAIPVRIELRDGSRLVGRITPQEFDFVRDDGRRLQLSTKQTVLVEADDDRELFTVRLADRSERGAVEWKQVEISGVFGTVKVPFEHVKRIEFVQPNLGLVAHFPFDSDCRDSSGNNNHGELHGDVEFAAGKVGKAASFDGEGDYISVVPKSEVAKIGDFTLSAWVFVAKWKTQRAGIGYDLQYVFDGFSEPKRGIYHTNGFGLICDSGTNNEQLRCYVLVDETNYRRYKPAVQLAGQWRLLTFTRHQDREFTYIDGKPAGSAAKYLRGTTTQPLDMAHTWHIGTFGANDPNFRGIKEGRRYDFLGRIDDLRIYDRALSTHEVQHLAMGGLEK